MYTNTSKPNTPRNSLSNKKNSVSNQSDTVTTTGQKRPINSSGSDRDQKGSMSSKSNRKKNKNPNNSPITKANADVNSTEQEKNDNQDSPFNFKEYESDDQTFVSVIQGKDLEKDQSNVMVTFTKVEKDFKDDKFNLNLNFIEPAKKLREKLAGVTGTVKDIETKRKAIIYEAMQDEALQQRRANNYEDLVNWAMEIKNNLMYDVLEKAKENLTNIDKGEEPPNYNFELTDPDNNTSTYNELTDDLTNHLDEKLDENQNFDFDNAQDLQPFHFSDQERRDEFNKGVWVVHAENLAAASSNYTFAIRSTGPNSVKRIAQGAKAKPHTILEKSIKEGAFNKYYKGDTDKVEKHLNLVKRNNIDGFVGHWHDNQLTGVRVDGIEKTYPHGYHVISDHGDDTYYDRLIKKINEGKGYVVGIDGGFRFSDGLEVHKFTKYKMNGDEPELDKDGKPIPLETGYIIPVEMEKDNDGFEYIEILQKKKDWQQYLYTGDYDLHEAYNRAGAGGYAQIQEGDPTKVQLLQRLNDAVSSNPLQVFRTAKVEIGGQKKDKEKDLSNDLKSDDEIDVDRNDKKKFYDRQVHVKDADYAMFQHGDQATYLANQLIEAEKELNPAWQAARQAMKDQRARVAKLIKNKGGVDKKTKEKITDRLIKSAEKELSKRINEYENLSPALNAKIVDVVTREDNDPLVWFHQGNIYVTKNRDEHSEFRELIKVQSESNWPSSHRHDDDVDDDGWRIGRNKRRYTDFQGKDQYADDNILSDLEREEQSVNHLKDAIAFEMHKIYDENSSAKEIAETAKKLVELEERLMVAENRVKIANGGKAPVYGDVEREYQLVENWKRRLARKEDELEKRFIGDHEDLEQQEELSELVDEAKRLVELREEIKAEKRKIKETQKRLKGMRNQAGKLVALKNVNPVQLLKERVESDVELLERLLGVMTSVEKGLMEKRVVGLPQVFTIVRTNMELERREKLKSVKRLQTLSEQRENGGVSKQYVDDELAKIEEESGRPVHSNSHLFDFEALMKIMVG